MAVVTVTADNNRVEDGEDATGFSNIGGGASGAAEAPFAYQGSNLFNRKVTSSTGAGFSYNPVTDGGSAVDMTASNRTTWMVKCMVSDYGGLDSTDGVIVRIGSDGSNYYAFVLAGSDSPAANFAAYRDIGGLLVIPVDPNENANYNDTGKDAGSPTLTAVDYFGYVCAFSSSSAKNENCGLDAIDIGSGLYLVGGDGADPDGTWQDFVDEDGNTTANRWGYARNADGGGILALGNLRIGTDDDSTSTATVFNDVGAVITWLDHLAGAGFNVTTVDLGSASSTVTDGSLHIGAGDTTNTDSRPDYTVSGTAGTGTFSHTLRNYRNVTYTSACTVTGDIQCADLTHGSATFTAPTIKCNSASGVAVCDDFSYSDASDINFIQTGSGHAVEETTPGTYDWDGHQDSGFGGTRGTNSTANSGANDALFYNNSGGLVTLNPINGAQSPSVRNGAGATTTVNTPQTSFSFTVSPLPSPDYEYRLYEVTAIGSLAGANEVAGNENQTTATPSSYQHTYTNQPFALQIISNDYEEVIKYYTLNSGTNISDTINLETDNND